MDTPQDFSQNHRADLLPPEATAWLQQHAEEDAASIEEMWHLTAFLQSDPAEARPSAKHIDGMEARIAAAIQQPDRAPMRRVRHRVLRRWPVLAAAASLVLAVGLGFWLQPVEHIASAGTMATIDLPDGSAVTLNSGSRLSYQRPFTWFARRVQLHGEAYFAVTPAEAPFVVETFNGAVTVLGTRFNVRAWPESNAAATEVVLEEGSVQLAAGQQAGVPVILQPGQMSRILADAPQPTPPAPVAVETKMAWRAGAFRFLDTPLGDVLDELARRTNQTIRVSDPALREARVGIILDEVESVEAVLAILSEIRDLRFEQTAEGFVVSPL